MRRRRDPSFRERSASWFARHPLGLSEERPVKLHARLIAEAYKSDGAKAAEQLFASIIRKNSLTLAEQVVLRDEVFKLIPRPSKKPSPPRKKASKTFAQARAEVLDALERAGWSLSPRSLKTPYATSPSGEIRLWFKSQAVYVSRGNHHSLGNAHTYSYDLDIRTMSGSEFVSMVERRFTLRLPPP